MALTDIGLIKPATSELYDIQVHNTNMDTIDNEVKNIYSKIDSIEVQTMTNDLTDELKSNYDDAVSKSHTHTNKSVLDNITTEKVHEWDNKSDFSGSYNDLTDLPTEVDADTVNGHTVESDIPSDAKFTDTVYIHPNSGVSVGTYKSVTVDLQGHITGGTNPTTLEGYGIIDAASSEELENEVARATESEENLQKTLDTKVDSVKIGTTEYKSGTTVTLPVYTTEEADTTFGADIALTIDTSTYKMTLDLKDNKGNTLASKEIDFPIESMVVNATYSSGILTLTLQNGTTLPVDISSIISGLVPDSRTIAGVDLKDNITATELRTALNIEDGANAYTHPTSGVTAGTYRSVTVNAQGHVTGGSNPTMAIGQGGTGATNTKAAQYNLLNDMNEITDTISDDSLFVGAYMSPTNEKGALYKKTFSVVWNYVKEKISSILGLSETGLASGKSIGGIKTISTTTASNSTGHPTYLLMFDVTTWYNSTTTNQAKSGFMGQIYSTRGSGNLQDQLATVYMGVSYKKATTEDGTYLLLRTDNASYRPCIIHDTTNDKYYLSLQIFGFGGRNIRLHGVFTGTYVGTKLNSTDSSGTLPTGYEMEISGYKIITHARATADADGNTITSTYATKTEMGKKYDATTSRTANTVLAAPNGSDGTGTFRKLVANDLPTVPASKGGTGQTTLNASMKILINSLGSGTAVPQDADYFISQSVGGGTTDTSYIRRPISALWEYMKDKADGVYLKLTGGTLTTSAYYGLNVKRSDANGSAISYQNSNGALGGAGFLSDGNFQISSGSNTSGDIFKANTTSATFPGTVTATTFNGDLSGNASDATKLATARTIDGVSFDGSEAITHYGTCSTAAATVAKTVACTGFTLVTGARILVKFTVTNTASSPTLNVNSTGAKAIMYRGSAITAGYLAANRVYEFVYDGTDWELVGDINTDTNTTYSNASLGQGYGTCATAAATTAKVVTLSNYALVTGGIVAVKFTYAVPASATMNINSKGAKSIYYKGSAITAGIIGAGDIGVFMYNGSQYHLLAIDGKINSSGGGTTIYYQTTEPTGDNGIVWIG